MNYADEIAELEKKKDELVAQYNSLLQGTSKADRIKKQQERKRLNKKIFKAGNALYKVFGEKIFDDEYFEGMKKTIMESEKEI